MFLKDTGHALFTFAFSVLAHSGLFKSLLRWMKTKQLASVSRFSHLEQRELHKTKIWPIFLAWQVICWGLAFWPVPLASLITPRLVSEPHSIHMGRGLAGAPRASPSCPHPKSVLRSEPHCVYHILTLDPLAIRSLRGGKNLYSLIQSHILGTRYSLWHRVRAEPATTYWMHEE